MTVTIIYNELTKKVNTLYYREYQHLGEVIEVEEKNYDLHNLYYENGKLVNHELHSADLQNNINIGKRKAIKKRIEELKQLLSSTDYQAIKYAEGELTEEEYSQMKNQRKQWRLEINNLEIELNQIKKSS